MEGCINEWTGLLLKEGGWHEQAMLGLCKGLESLLM